jgi:hypothetical protein
MSIWGKVAIGCGAATLIFLGSVGILVWWGVTKASSALDQGWAELYRDAEGLRSEAGSRALYRANPGLAQGYPTEEGFLEAAAGWRPRLGPVPEHRPDLKTLFDHRTGADFGMKSERANGSKSTEVHLRMSTGATLEVQLEDGHLTDIRVD